MHLELTILVALKDPASKLPVRVRYSQLATLKYGGTNSDVSPRSTLSIVSQGRPNHVS